MDRVRFPLIVRYSMIDSPYQYAKEDFDEHGFGRTEDQLLATVYTSSKMFSRLFGESATKWLKRQHDHPLNDIASLIYVGDKA